MVYIMMICGCDIIKNTFVWLTNSKRHFFFAAIAAPHMCDKHTITYLDLLCHLSCRHSHRLSEWCSSNNPKSTIVSRLWHPTMKCIYTLAEANSRRCLDISHIHRWKCFFFCCGTLYRSSGKNNTTNITMEESCRVKSKLSTSHNPTQEIKCCC